MRTHTHQHQHQHQTTPVPDSTPPEHRPNTEDAPGAWDHLATRGAGPTPVTATPPRTGPSRWVAVVACGVTALALGLIVPVAALAELAVADQTSLQVAVACLMPVLVGLTFWSATTMLSGAERRPALGRR